MEIYILRHGIAVNRGTPGYKKESDRPLTPEGEEKLHQSAKAMLAMERKFHPNLSSPYFLPQQTAHLGAAELDEEITLTDLLTPDGNPLELIRELNDEKPQSVLLVGHEPYFSGLISVLVTGESNATIELKKGGLCKLSADRVAFGQCATFNWLLTPKQMRLMV